MRACLERVARQIEEDPVELITIGLDREVGRDRALDRQLVRRDSEARAYFVDQRRERKTVRRQRRRALVRKVKGAGAQRDGAIDRVEKARR